MPDFPVFRAGVSVALVSIATRRVDDTSLQGIASTRRSTRLTGLLPWKATVTVDEANPLEIDQGRAR
ncbi:hypothetical protein CEE69_10820 [Rhodopirellula bahusiensis]|uniref:Uncharacterized protein n=1 Tax=Rhodopirellula bahusiensis TaxID=2014065 RepID=A0A2G1W8Y3_9BACT|nr:hypothetical protein CEE69_10820 [Rhodopirellula bahusiensis]